jgi:hypothetical protein
VFDVQYFHITNAGIRPRASAGYGFTGSVVGGRIREIADSPLNN